jgi:hypothetical protein
MDDTGTLTTYTDYDSIPLATLKHVIAFEPDIGTKVDSNEILLETDTLDSGETDNFVTEPTLTSIEVELETGTSTGGLLLETGDDVRMEDETFLEERTFTVGDNLVLNGTDSSSTNAGSNLIMEFADGRHKLVPEDFATGDENHLMLETASDDQTINHYHLPTGPHHTDGDGHTEAEHRELALWNYKLQLLMIQERS